MNEYDNDKELDDSQGLSDEEQHQELDDSNRLSDFEYALLVEEYKKKKKLETILGPILSTIVHIALIVILVSLFIYFFNKEEVKEEHAIPTVEDQKKTINTPKIDDEPKEPSQKIESKPTENATENNPVLNPGDITETDDTPPDTITNQTIGNPTNHRSEGNAIAIANNIGDDYTVSNNRVQAALRWLTNKQKSNGYWEHVFKKRTTAQSVGITALAVLSYLACNYVPDNIYLKKEKEAEDPKKLPLDVRHHIAVTKGFKVITDYLKKNPSINTSRDTYSYIIACYALADYCQLTKAYRDDKENFQLMNKSINRLIEGQSPRGGYTYLFDYKRSKQEDLSVTGFAIQALSVARDASFVNGTKINKALNKALNYIKISAADNFPYGHVLKNKKWTLADPGKHTMQNVGSLCLMYLGEYSAGKTFLNKQSQYDLYKEPYSNNNLYPKMYYMYYGVLAAWSTYPQDLNLFKYWFDNAKVVLKETQIKGSLDKNVGSWAGKVYETSLGILIYRSYIRYPAKVDSKDSNDDYEEIL